MRIISSIVVIAIVGNTALAQNPPPEVQKAIDAVRKHIDAMPHGKDAGEVIPQVAASVKKTFQAHVIVLARFRQFPVARIMPEGLQSSNIFAVTKDGKIEHLKNVKTLEKFFRTHDKMADEASARRALAAWLALSQEFRQDGMFKFEVMEKEFSVKEGKAIGRAVVMQGGNGELTAELTIGKDGVLASATEKAAIRPGPRPICQATKLLDADPIVRRMAEQDLLIMGLSARSYLMEQRDRANGELRLAIDRMWERIQKNGW